ncbi:MAG: mannose-1-phosphate guanylyltransferase [Marinomonas primoryensis]
MSSGIFLFRASQFLAELQQHRLEIYAAVELAYRTEDLDFMRIGAEAFEACPSESIDYVVMEPTLNAKVMFYYGDWSDISLWDALHDCRDNVLAGDVMAEYTHNSLIRSE